VPVTWALALRTVELESACSQP